MLQKINAMDFVDGFVRSLGADLVGVLLYGSRARGDASVESDWDVVLFDRSGCVARRVENIRMLITGAGLSRERTPMGDAWRWKKNPGRAWVLELEASGWQQSGAAGIYDPLDSKFLTSIPEGTNVARSIASL